MFTLPEYDLYRPVDWRYRRADYLRSKGRYARRHRDDDYTRVAKNFLVAKEKCDDDTDEERLARQMPGLWYAYKTFQRVDSNKKHILEARVLAGESIPVVADKLKTDPAMVFWYEKVFFDVREYLRHKDYIVTEVLGP